VACETLLEKVLERGGTDNVTIIVVRMTAGLDRAAAMPDRTGARQPALSAVEFE
jgi:serine/threonine protein phosphatase PrpC